MKGQSAGCGVVSTPILRIASSCLPSRALCFRSTSSFILHHSLMRLRKALVLMLSSESPRSVSLQGVCSFCYTTLLLGVVQAPSDRCLKTREFPCSHSYRNWTPLGSEIRLCSVMCMKFGFSQTYLYHLLSVNFSFCIGGRRKSMRIFVKYIGFMEKI